MATDVERLVLSMEANMKKFERAFAQASGTADRNMRQIERRVEQSESRVEATMGRVGSAIRAGIAGALASISLQSFTKLSDTFTKVQNQLKVGGLEGDRLAKTYKELFDIAQQQGAPLEQLATLYGRASTAQKELNASSADLMRFTSATATALRVGGTSAEEASGALLQLSQVLGSSKVQAEEYNSLIDGLRPLLQAAAAGIEEAGGSVSKLTALVKDGKVSSEAFFRGVLAGKPAIDALAQATRDTSEQALTRLNNALVDFVGKLGEATGASDNAVLSINNFAKGVQGLAGSIPDAIELLKKLADQAQSTATSIGNAPIFKRLAEKYADPAAVKALEDKMNAAQAVPAGKAGAVEGIDALRKAMRDRMPAAPAAGNTGDSIFDQVAALDAKALAGKTISLKDYKVPGEKDKKAGGSKTPNDYEREVQAIGRRTRALDDERSVVGESAYEVARSEAALRLEEAAKKANLTVTEAMQIRIDELASAYGRAKVALDEAEKKQRDFQEASSVAGHTLSDAFKDAILNGEKLTDVMDKLLKSLASRGIDGFFDSLFAKGGAGSTFLSSILGSFADGGYTGPGGKYQPAGVVHRGEYVMDAATTRRIGRGNLDAIRRGRGYASGGFVGAPMAPMAPPAVRSAGRAAGGLSITKADTYNIMPAAGVTPDQLRAVLEAHDRALPSRLKDIQRRMG